MGLQSLRDKLLQAGLVTEDQAKTAETQQRPGPGPGKEAASAKPKDRRGGQGRPREAKAGGGGKALTPEEKLAREEEAAFRERERMLNRERDENRKRAAEDRKRLEGLRQAAEKHEVEERGEEAFHFTTRKKKVQRIYLTAEQLERLEAGDLAIIDKPLPGELSFALVSREGAERALALDSKAVRFYNRGFGQTFGFKAEPPPVYEAPAAEESGLPADEPSADATAPKVEGVTAGESSADAAASKADGVAADEPSADVAASKVEGVTAGESSADAAVSKVEGVAADEPSADAAGPRPADTQGAAASEAESGGDGSKVSAVPET